MNPRTEMPEIDPQIPEHAVSVYGQSDGAYDDFPVLKAFQQYIDSEQAKARKRMLLLCAFFGILMLIVIAVFVGLLVSASSRNQLLNDRLVEYVMKDREQRSAVVAQPPTQDNSAIQAMTAKLDELQKKLAESQANTIKAAADAADKANRAAHEEAAKQKGPTVEQLEIERLKALLAAEREKQALEREKQRQAELEAYRRKHYPDLYEKKEPVKKDEPEKLKTKTPKKSANDELLEEVDQILNESKAVSYFDDEAEDDSAPVKKAESPSLPQPQPAPKKEFSIPVDVRGSSSRWSVPNE